MRTYLYNGVPLPDIFTVYTPEMQQTHPFGYIFYIPGIEKYDLEIFSVPLSEADGCLYASEQHMVCGWYEKNGEWGTFWVDDDEQSGAMINITTVSLIWSNTDIRYKDSETVYFAASDPVPVLSIYHTAMVQGWIAGMRIAGQRRKKEPVAYLYGTCEEPLPALPDLPKFAGYDEFQYVALECYVGEKGVSAYAYATTRQLPIRAAGSLGTADNILQCTDFACSSCAILKDNKVVKTPEWSDASFVRAAGYSFVWANYDLYRTDGTLYIETSEPIPVYE